MTFEVFLARFPMFSLIMIFHHKNLEGLNFTRSNFRTHQIYREIVVCQIFFVSICLI